MTPRPVSVSIDVPQPRADVYAYLDVMANHEPFTDHMLTDWEYSGPASGIGSKARVKSSFGALTDTADIEVVAASAPALIVERNVSAKGRRVATGTYTLDELPDDDGGGTRVTFTYAWEKAPLPDRVLAPVVRSVLKRGNATAMTRLRERLAGGVVAH
ncbi:SRPBCC family protein [Baekduia sp. Peel2402]|uniref:SRPBCC family protein n=1 Tax=Baekduia sp. Peel2402 TaxID=3458296 RepID=UPI00403ECDCC